MRFGLARGIPKPIRDFFLGLGPTPLAYKPAPRVQAADELRPAAERAKSVLAVT